MSSTTLSYQTTEAAAQSRSDVSRRAMPQPRSGLVWLASYPRSGNTWTRAFLHNLFKGMSGDAGTQNINELNRFTAAVNGRELYAETLGFNPTDEHRNEIAAVRHEVQRRAAEQFEGLIFTKTHQALLADRGSTTINFAVTAGAIYIIRNPLDVAVSYAHHLGCSLDETIASMGRANAEIPMTETQVHEVIGSWSQHVLSWTHKPHQAIYVMRYEDMLATPERTFGGLARHLLLNPTPKQLAYAIERSSFTNLRVQEESEGFRERSSQTDRFFREGRAGQWKEVLTKGQVTRIVDDHGPQMARFGYLLG
jgi:Sulfotransferase domain